MRQDVSTRLVRGDIIVGIEGRTISTSADLTDVLDAYGPGDKVQIRTLRDGSVIDVPATLADARP